MVGRSICWGRINNRTREGLQFPILHPALSPEGHRLRGAGPPPNTLSTTGVAPNHRAATLGLVALAGLLQRYVWSGAAHIGCQCTGASATANPSRQRKLGRYM